MEWIDTTQKLYNLCAHIEDSWALAIDTESDGFHAYNSRVCLIQVATEDRLALIDPLALPADAMEPFLAILEEPEPLKIFHAAQNDLLAMQRDFNVDVRGIFDTYEAVRFLGRTTGSLDSLLKEHFDVHVSKRYQRFNWRIRPLPEGALDYAASDVRYLIELYGKLACDLEESGWFDAHYELCRSIARNTSYEESHFDPDAYFSIRGSRGLPPQVLSVLRALRIWRHEVCTRTNRAAFMIIDDPGLINIATAMPTELDQLHDIQRLSRRAIEHYGSRLLTLIAEARTQEAPPASPNGRNAGKIRLNANQNANFEALRTWRNRLKETSPLPSDLIATNDILRHIAHRAPRNLDELALVPGILNWQIERLGAEILRALRKS